MGFTPFRELTRAELRDIRQLASSMYANFDRDYGCLLLDERCYMHYGPAYTNSALCKYFRKAVLPLNPQMEALLSGENVAEQIKHCAVCGGEFMQSGKSLFCSDVCRYKSKRSQDRESLRKHRKNKRP